MSCPDGWKIALLEKAKRPGTKSTFNAGRDIPYRFAQKTAPGRSAFLAWAQMPTITYSAAPDTLYDMKKLDQLLAGSECYNKSMIEEQNNKVVYPKAFYAGLLLAGGAVVLSLVRK